MFGNIKGNNYRHSQFVMEMACFNIIINFPANWLQLDVARENITGFSSDKRPYQIFNQIASNLYNQILQYIKYSENNVTNVQAIYLQNVIKFTLNLYTAHKIDEELHRKLMALKYIVKIEFLESGLCYKIMRNKLQNKPLQIIYYNEKAREIRYEILKNFYQYNKIKDINNKNIDDISKLKFYERRIFGLFEEILRKNNLTIDDRIMNDLKFFLNEANINFKIKNDGKDIFKLFTLILLNTPDEIILGNSKELSHIDSILETILLQYFFVGKEEKQELHFSYNELFEIDGNDSKKGYRAEIPTK